MPERELMSVAQPCVLCEKTLLTTVLYRDDETGAERWEHHDEHHECLTMKLLLKEKRGIAGWSV